MTRSEGEGAAVLSTFDHHFKSSILLRKVECLEDKEIPCIQDPSVEPFET